MRKSLVLFVLGLLLYALVHGTEAEAAKVMTLKMGKGQATVSLLDGSAKVLPDGRKEWRNLKVKDVLRAGDEVSTGTKSRLEVVLPDRSRVRFADNSRFRILQMEKAEEAKQQGVRIHVAIGRSWANINKTFAGRSGFSLSCDNAVAGVRGTVYRMNVNEDKSALIRVYDGTVEVSGGGEASQQKSEGPGPVMGTPTRVAGPRPVAGPKRITLEEWTVLLKSMQQITVRSDGTTDKPRDFTVAEDRDAWVDWNRQQDQEAGS